MEMCHRPHAASTWTFAKGGRKQGTAKKNAATRSLLLSTRVHFHAKSCHNMINNLPE